MMYNEFLKLTNLDEDDITIETYNNIIEPMYMATDLNKCDFVKTLSIKNITNMFESPKSIINKIIEVAKELKNVNSVKRADYLSNKFVELAKKYCELRGLKFDGVLFNYNREYVGIDEFYVHYGNTTMTFRIKGNKLTIETL